ncbi:MAG: NlpC/P60 family protein [Desulfuromonadaceae bacterium]|nr:NlpC/P60 family protein [Desulfuromonadaceae bacterium]
MYIFISTFIRILSADAAEYGVALAATPVLNSPDFAAVFGGMPGAVLKTDRCGQVRALEYIALPGTVFTILKKLPAGSVTIFQVETDEYTAPENVRLYVDSRFLLAESAAPLPRRRSLYSQEEIVLKLRASAGSPYVWGGNVLNGIPEHSVSFNKDTIPDGSERQILTGLDCSGLLYHATGGWTPRNTLQLTEFGQSVAIAGKQGAEIAAQLQPLDLIVWSGHVIIVLDRQTAIESCLACDTPGNGGVVLTPLSQRLTEIMRARRPANAWSGGAKNRNIFVIRRWYAL